MTRPHDVVRDVHFPVEPVPPPGQMVGVPAPPRPVHESRHAPLGNEIGYPWTPAWNVCARTPVIRTLNAIQAKRGLRELGSVSA